MKNGEEVQPCLLSCFFLVSCALEFFLCSWELGSDGTVIHAHLSRNLAGVFLVCLFRQLLSCLEAVQLDCRGRHDEDTGVDKWCKYSTVGDYTPNLLLEFRAHSCK